MLAHQDESQKVVQMALRALATLLDSGTACSQTHSDTMCLLIHLCMGTPATLDTLQDLFTPPCFKSFVCNEIALLIDVLNKKHGCDEYTQYLPYLINILSHPQSTLTQNPSFLLPSPPPSLTCCSSVTRDT